MADSLLPALKEVEPGIYELWFYRDTNFRSRILLFSGLATFSSVIIACFIVQAILKPPQPNWSAMLVAMPFWLLWNGFMFCACFCSIRCVVDATARQLIHEFRILDRVVRHRERRIEDGDKLGIHRHRHERTRTNHEIYAIRNDRRWRFTSFELPGKEESADVAELTKQIAQLLHIESRGYDAPKYFWDKL